MSDEEAGSSSSSTPEPPEPMDAEEEEASVEGKTLEEAVRGAVAPQEEEDELDLKGMAKDFAGYLVVDSKQDVSTRSIVQGEQLRGCIFGRCRCICKT